MTIKEMFPYVFNKKERREEHVYMHMYKYI